MKRCLCDPAPGPPPTCRAYAGECANGELIEQASRTQDNQCGSCDDGYYLSGVACEAYEGTCENGDLVAQALRTADDQCGTCDDGYYLSGTICDEWGGTCANGELRELAQRTDDDQCASCHAGYYMVEDEARCEVRAAAERAPLSERSAARAVGARRLKLRLGTAWVSHGMQPCPLRTVCEGTAPEYH